MNRQLRRANEKSDKRREREQERRKEQRQASRARVTRPKPSAKEKAAAEQPAKDENPAPAPGTRRPGLTGAYLLLTIGVIATQIATPQRTDIFSLVIHALFYLILGYFLCLWLYRRGTKQAFVISLVGGLLLAFGVEGLKLVVPPIGQPTPEAGSSEPNLLFALLALPGLLLGSWLGQYIFRRS